MNPSLEEQMALIERAGLFDPCFYLESNPDIAEKSGDALLLHFCKVGWREFRDPSPSFQLFWYFVKYLGGGEYNANPLLHYIAIGQAKGFSTLCLGMGTTAERASFNSRSLALIDSLRPDAATYARVSRLLGRIDAWDLAEVAAAKAVELEPVSGEYIYLLGEALVARRIWWRACDELLKAVQIYPSRVEWLVKLADAYMHMLRFNEAVDTYKRALHLEPTDAHLHYLLGEAQCKAGKAYEAEASFRRALELDCAEDVKRFGLGVLHQANGNWFEAATAYSEVANVQASGEIHYRRGFALEHCYRWEEARDAYLLALKAESRPEWHYRIGQVYERLGQYYQAAHAYTQALSNGTVIEWSYRLGYVWYCAGEYKKAAEAWLQAGEAAGFVSVVSQGDAADLREELAKQGGTAERYYRLGIYLECNHRWRDAAEAYEAALARKNCHEPAWYFRLGYARLKAGNLQSACEAFSELVIFKRPALMTPDPNNPRQEYLEYFETLPVRQGVIMYESYTGHSIACNPLAIFKCLLQNKKYDQFIHVWAVKDILSAPLEYRVLPNVVFVEYESSLYRRYLATAQYLINNLWFPPYFIRREGQYYLNTWHGTPLKSLGKYVPGSFLAYKNTARNFLQATHLITPNSHTSRVLLESYDVAGIFSGSLAETGYPRTDAVRGNPDISQSLRERLNLDESRPVVLYAPTWRGTIDNLESDVPVVIEVLHRLLEQDSIQLLFRSHHFVEKAVLGKLPAVTVATADIDSCELLSVVDVLITDYSSILFDFLPTGRPIIFYAYDIEAYQRVQGPLAFDLKELPGEFCTSLEQLMFAVNYALSKNNALSDKYEIARQQFCPHEDGGSSLRAVSFFFENSKENVVAHDVKRPILFHVGAFVPNGITASALNLMAGLEKFEEPLAVTVDPWNLESYAVRRKNLSRLTPAARVIPRAGFMVLSCDESWHVDRFNDRCAVDDERIWEILIRAYRREFRRLFGSTHFSAAIDFCGYNIYWSCLFALGANASRKAIFLHADMQSEVTTRQPSLLAQFHLLPHFDSIVSVSDSHTAAHREFFSKQYNIEPGRFVTCENMLDHQSIVSGATAPLESDLEPWFDGGTTFLALGRLSPEKDHEKLIRAFAGVIKCYAKARLVIAGDGPLKLKLSNLIKELDLQGHVLLAGYRSNPFALLSRCSCFVLSSNYEGQPLALLEAMVLQRPIIATDIEANRAILSCYYGELAPNSELGLAQAMIDYLNGGQLVKPFSVIDRQERILKRFRKLVGGL